MYMSSPTRGSSLLFGKVTDCLGCAVLLCLVVCSTLLASFFLPSHLSLNHVHFYDEFWLVCGSCAYTPINPIMARGTLVYQTREFNTLTSTQ